MKYTKKGNHMNYIYIYITYELLSVDSTKCLSIGSILKPKQLHSCMNLFLFPSLYLYNSVIFFYSFDINFLFILYISVLINAMLIYLFVKNINNLVYLYFESLYT